jgi:hypothetical protein
VHRSAECVAAGWNLDFNVTVSRGNAVVPPAIDRATWDRVEGNWGPGVVAVHPVAALGPVEYSAVAVGDGDHPGVRQPRCGVVGDRAWVAEVCNPDIQNRG